MQIEIFDNLSREFGSGLLPAVAAAEDVRIAVAFLSGAGVRSFEPAAMQCLERGGRIDILVGLDLELTEPEGLKALYDLSRHHRALSCYCLTRARRPVLFHPKLYLMRQASEVAAFIGSSNLTEGGLRRNREVNVMIRASLDDEFTSDIYDAYNALKFIPHRVQPDEELLALYAELSRRVRGENALAKRCEEFRRLRARFWEKAESLPRAIAAVHDLVGWQKLVYQHLPEGSFTNQDVYAFTEVFAARYPENMNVRAKVRQQLQRLRDLGLIQSEGRARWKKLGALNRLSQQTVAP
jgi:HKD family nuclease